jgi:hypothetical protein
MFVNGSGRNEQYLQRIFHRCFLPSFGTFRQAVSEKIFKNQQYLYRDNCILNTDIYIKTSVIFLLTEIFWKSTNQKQELPVAAMLVNRSGQNEQFFIEDLRRMLPTKFRFIWPSGFRGEDFFRNQPIRNKNGLWRPCLSTDRDEISNLYRDPAIDASYQVSVHLAKRFQRRRFLKIGLSETRIAYGGHVC